MATIRSAGGGSILWLTTKSSALAFQSQMTSADAGRARPSSATATKALR